MAVSQGRDSALLVLVLFCALVSVARGVQHPVGGSGVLWAIPAYVNANYTLWASTQKFVVGDTLFFNYSKALHNVLEVTKTNYDSCNAASPMATYDDGATTISLTKTGSFYFICGFPTHCTQGQKVEIMVTSSSASSPTPSPASAASSPTPVSPSSETSPAPTVSSGEAPGPSLSATGSGSSPRAASAANTLQEGIVATSLMVAVSALAILV